MSPSDLPRVPRLQRRQQQAATAPVVSYAVTTGTVPVNRWVEIRGPGRGLRLRRDGAHDFFGVAELIKTIVRPGMTDTEKALAVYRFCMRHTYSFSMGWGEYDMNRFINAYGYSFCWGQADFQHLLMEAAGLRVRAPRLKGHSSCEVLLDGAWRVFDAYIKLLAPGHNLTGFATGRHLHQHPELFAALFPPDRAAALADYWTEWGAAGTYEPRLDSHAMMLTLRRGERLRLYHSNRGLWCLAPREPIDYVNGDWRYSPVLDAEHLAKETESTVNVVAEAGTLRPADPAKPATVEYLVHCPYPLVAGRLRLAFSGRTTARISVSSDLRRTWHDLGSGGGATRCLPLDACLSVREVPPGTAPATLARAAVHDVLVRLQWSGRVALEKLELAFVCQAHAPTVPRLESGTTRWQLVGGEAGAAVEHAWDEYPGTGVSDTGPLEGERITLQAAVHNPGRTVARRVPVRFVAAASGQVLAATSIPLIPPGAARTVSCRWRATARAASVAAAAGGHPDYVCTRVRIEVGPPRRQAGVAGEAALIVRPRPEPRVSDTLVWVGRDRRRDSDQLVLRAALVNSAAHARRTDNHAYVRDVPLTAVVTPFLGHPDRGGTRLAPPRRLDGILPGEFAVAEWRLPASALPRRGAVWFETVCDETVAPGRRRLLAQRALPPAALQQGP